MRQEKQLLLDEIKDKLQGHSSFVLARYTALKANAAHDFRSALARAGAEFEVVRKRVFLKALAGHGVDLPLEVMQGHVGVIFPKDDPIEAAKAVVQYGRENENNVEVLAGFIDGRLYDSNSVKRLSELPSLSEMRAQLLGLFVAPMSQTLAVMEALITSVMHALDNKAGLDKAPE